MMHLFCLACGRLCYSLNESSSTYVRRFCVVWCLSWCWQFQRGRFVHCAPFLLQRLFFSSLTRRGMVCFFDTLGIRAIVLDVQPFSQIGVDVLAMAWGLCSFLTVGCPVTHWFLDNAHATFMWPCLRALIGKLVPVKGFWPCFVQFSQGFQWRDACSLGMWCS